MNDNTIPHLITEQVYENWAIAWKELETETKSFEFFKSEKGALTAVVFDGENISSLISTTGISTIKIRFGFDKEEGSFKIILYGTDLSGQILTPYYVPARTVYSGKSLLEGHGKVPKELMNQWLENWVEQVDNDTVASKNFMTPYGFTRGYNYPLEEFIQPLFKFEKSPEIFVCFVMHKYFGINYLTTKETTSTFGVVLQGRGVATENDSKSDPYYDLTAPCPRTC